MASLWYCGEQFTPKRVIAEDQFPNTKPNADGQIIGDRPA
jgi:hypothetical protein